MLYHNQQYTTQNTSVKQRLIFLDGLRGYAALIVVIHHYAMTFAFASVYGWPNLDITKNLISFSSSPWSFIINGNAAVNMYFALSGFMIYYTLNNKTSINIISQLIKRYVRLTLPIIVVLLFTHMLMLLKLNYNITFGQTALYSNPHEWLLKHYFEILSIPKLLYDSFVGIYTHSPTSYSAVLWTMQYEAIGSVICIILFSRIKQISHFITAILLILVALFTIPQLFFAHILGFIVGFVVTNKYKLSQSLSIIITIIGLYFLSFPYVIKASIYQLPYEFIQHYILDNTLNAIHAIGAAFTIYGLFNANIIHKLFENKVAQLFGKLSYSVYLTHGIVLFFISTKLGSYIKEYPLELQIILHTITALPIILLLSYLLYYFIEIKLTKLVLQYIK